jgi:hypothetical protein
MPTETLERPSAEYISDAEWLASRRTTTFPAQAILSAEPPIRLIGSPMGGFILTVGDASPPWIKPAVRGLSALLELPSDWDSYGGVRIKPEIVIAALNLLFETMQYDSPAPSIVPTSRGGIQLEWHRNGVDLEVEFVSPSRVRGVFEDRQNGDTWDRDLFYDLGPLTKAIAELSHNR